jgi:hypothetical protein
MRLGFLMENVYAPYPKWFGTAFQRLDCAAELSPHLQQALASQSWQERESHLVLAYEKLARMHNRLSVTSPLPETVRDFFGRPFRVMALHGFSGKLLERIHDPAVKKLASKPLIGNIDLSAIIPTCSKIPTSGRSCADCLNEPHCSCPNAFSVKLPARFTN